MKAVILLILGLCISAGAEEQTLRVCAAASLVDVLKSINVNFEQSTGVKVLLSLGSSNTLARQIEAGAPVDVFFSADVVQMERLEKRGLIDIKTKKMQLSNSLVVVQATTSKGSFTAAKDFAGFSKIALADPRAVPAGIYAKKWLEKLDLWTMVEGKVVAMDNVRATLAVVESSNVDVGIVYKTDAAISNKVKVVYEVPRSETPQITYPVAVLSDAKNAKMAKRYVDFLDSMEATQSFEKFGFLVLSKLPASEK